MVLRKNLPFAAALGAAVVVFILALVWLLGRVSTLTKVKGETASQRAALAAVERKVPTKEHLAAIKKQHGQAEAAYAKLKEQLLAWWDKDVYDPDESSRQPGLFLGSLQELQGQLISFAESQGVWLGSGVENLAFPELAEGKTPVEVTFEMLKQRSAVRDVITLLIHDKVESIDAINWLGSDKGGSLYGKYRVSVVFTCKYPSLAKFQADLVNKAKVSVPGHGDFPRNFLVIEQLAYQAKDLKAAGTESIASRTSSTRTTPRRTTSPSSNILDSRREGFDKLPPSVREAILRREAAMRAHAARSTVRTTRTTPRTTPARDEDKPTVGREPNYNILTVKMTIALVDFNQEITGKIPALEEEKKKSKGSRRTETATRGSR
jgi:hypothetical protein